MASIQRECEREAVTEREREREMTAVVLSFPEDVGEGGRCCCRTETIGQSDRPRDRKTD